jgi:hypothetical protein
LADRVGVPILRQNASQYLSTLGICKDWKQEVSNGITASNCEDSVILPTSQIFGRNVHGGGEKKNDDYLEKFMSVRPSARLFGLCFSCGSLRFFLVRIHQLELRHCTNL